MIERDVKAANEPEALLWVNKPAVGSLLRGYWPDQCGFYGAINASFTLAI